MQFINGKESLVVDALDGLLRSSGGANLARFDGYPGIKVRCDPGLDSEVAVQHFRLFPHLPHIEALDDVAVVDDIDAVGQCHGGGDVLLNN